MTFIYTVRSLFVLLAGIFGALICYLNPGLEGNPYTWGTYGLLLGSFVVLVESFIREAYPKTLVVGVGGLLIGLVVASLTTAGIPSPPVIAPATRAIAVVGLYLFLGYLGAVVALRYVERIDLSSNRVITAEDPRLRACRILDSSVLIDARILDIVATGFLEGIIVIPRFVIDELQLVADSADAGRRQRGRRGLDTVRDLQEQVSDIIVLEKDYPHIQAVDAKLIQLAKDYEGRILTNDFNLNKVAEIHAVRVLNINDLANALKPIIVPGETLTVKVIKPGKEHGQGVAYLEDGTMVVVENGIDHLREEVDVSVTSMLQTAAGRLIFSRIISEHEAEMLSRAGLQARSGSGRSNVVDLEL